MKKLTETRSIPNLYSYLKASEADEIIVRTTYCKGGWDDNNFDAHAAGFDIYRFHNEEYAARHEFSECYKFVRRASK